MENEILSAEVFLDSFRLSVDTHDLDSRMEDISRRLQSYACDASLADCGVAVVCGLLAGAADSFLGNQLSLSDSQLFVPWVRLDSLLCAGTSGAASSRRKGPAGPDTISKELLLAFLSQVVQQSNPLAPLAYIAMQCIRSNALCFSKKGISLPEKLSRDSGILLLAAVAVAALIHWLLMPPADSSGWPSSHPALSSLREKARDIPVVRELVACLDKWPSQLYQQMTQTNGKSFQANSLHGIFASLLLALAAMPSLQHTFASFRAGALQAVELDRAAPPILRTLTRQSLPVLLNELLVRSAYFVMHLLPSLSRDPGPEGIAWETVFPLNNRTVDRMITISSLTFSTADIMDAAVHSAVESMGNQAVFGARFVQRINYVAAGRLAVAVYREETANREEYELLQQRLLLQEEKTAKIAAALAGYRQAVEEKVSSYIAEDVTAFLQGLMTMDEGLRSGDSDRVIQGNVVIQRVLGREPQFTSQAEFDDLMASDLPLEL